MSDKLEVISASNLPDDRKPDVTQTGNENVAIANYGTVQMQVNQQFCGMPQLGGQFYVPPRINREYYNIFVIGTEEYDKPYFKVPRDRALSECMSKGDKRKILWHDERGQTANHYDAVSFHGGESSVR